jgi:hypothetical protein
MTETNRAMWDRYSEAWKETSRDKKLAALRASVVPTCTYRDPSAVVEGHDALVEHMLGFHQQVPGGWFDTQSFLTHHGRSVATWNMMSAEGQVIGHGISYAEYDDHGLLVAMTGFFAR